MGVVVETLVGRFEPSSGKDADSGVPPASPRQSGPQPCSSEGGHFPRNTSEAGDHTPDHSGSPEVQEKHTPTASRNSSASSSPRSSIAPGTPDKPPMPSAALAYRAKLTTRSPTVVAASGSNDVPVRAVLNIRPLLSRELKQGHATCLDIRTDKALPEVYVDGIIPQGFAFDRVYGDGATLPSSELFGDCVVPLVDGLFQGYNATILAYGQTGAGKTFTIGTDPQGAKGSSSTAIIPKLSAMLFDKAAKLAEESCSVRATVSFIELYQSSIYDLLADEHKRTTVEIRDHRGSNGTGAVAHGQKEVEVSTAEEVDACLQQGVAARASHSTKLNDLSSRSHAIFTVHLQVKRWQASSLNSSDSGNVEDVEETLSAKMHIVDLAGSERLKKSGVKGQQQKETANINLGLLSLRNCIEALCRPNCGHIPYRSHKLTRLLQDGLGGNARTVMIACVSPSDRNVDETLNTLKYTSNARNIKNKVVANRDEHRTLVAAAAEELSQLQELHAAPGSLDNHVLAGGGVATANREFQSPDCDPESELAAISTFREGDSIQASADGAEQETSPTGEGTTVPLTQEEGDAPVTVRHRPSGRGIRYVIGGLVAVTGIVTICGRRSKTSGVGTGALLPLPSGSRAATRRRRQDISPDPSFAHLV